MTTFNFSRQRGFSLVEIALVLVIVGVALGAGLTALGPQLKNRMYSETLKTAQTANEAVLAFAMVNRRLPCPAVRFPAVAPAFDSRGQEAFCTNSDPANCGALVFPPATSVGRVRGSCFVTANPNRGLVPAASLGLSGQNGNGLVIDAWAAPLRYFVPSTASILGSPNNPTLTPLQNCAGGITTCYPFNYVDGIRNRYYNPPTPPTTPISDVRVCNMIGAANCAGAQEISNPAFAILSTGANLNTAPPAISADETANVNNDRVLVSRERTEATAPAGFFDDVVVWTTIDQLIQKMQGNGAFPP